jgi:hypothetical protein
MKNWDLARSGKFAALTQRCIPIRYTLDDATVDSVLEGRHVFTLPPFSPKPGAKIAQKDFAKIRTVAAEVRESPPLNKEFRHVYMRSIGDLCRIFAVTDRLDQHLFRLVCYLKAGVELGQALELVWG